MTSTCRWCGETYSKCRTYEEAAKDLARHQRKCTELPRGTPDSFSRDLAWVKKELEIEKTLNKRSIDRNK